MFLSVSAEIWEQYKSAGEGAVVQSGAEEPKLYRCDCCLETDHCMPDQLTTDKALRVNTQTHSHADESMPCPHIGPTCLCVYM